MRKGFLWVILLFFCNQLFAWGFEPHKLINKHAVLMLPSPLFDFYKKHIKYITEHAVDPDKKRYIDTNEAPKHYIDMELFIGIDSTPLNYNAAQKKWEKDLIKKQGSVPWTVYFTMQRLQYAFEKQNLKNILKLSAELGHYVADLHVPLDTTENYNGQLTNQHGIHKLWETEVAGIYNNYAFLPNEAQYLQKPLDSIWKWMWESHDQLTNIFACEKKCRDKNQSGLTQSYTTQTNGIMSLQNNVDFIREYDKCLKLKVNLRMEESIQHIASCIYTSWILAGQPPLPDHNELPDEVALINKENTNSHDYGSCHH